MFATRALRSGSVPEGERVTKVMIYSLSRKPLNRTEVTGNCQESWWTRTHARLPLTVLIIINACQVGRGRRPSYA